MWTSTAIRNELFQHLNSQLGYPEWKIEILRAFQTWTRHSNVQFALAADSPRAFGVPGLAQGDPRFGDIRIGAFPQNEVLGNAVPYDPVFGSWSGDIFRNTNETYMVDDGQSSNFGYALYSVMLQEAGDALGLVDEMLDPTSVIFAYYVTKRSDLSPLDIADIQNLYGPPSADPYEPASNNDSFARATPIAFGNQFATTLIATRRGRIQSRNDRDFYRFTGTSLSENCWVKLRARGKSLLVGANHNLRRTICVNRQNFHRRSDLQHRRQGNYEYPSGTPDLCRG